MSRRRTPTVCLNHPSPNPVSFDCVGCRSQNPTVSLDRCPTPCTGMRRRVSIQYASNPRTMIPAITAATPKTSSRVASPTQRDKRPAKPRTRPEHALLSCLLIPDVCAEQFPRRAAVGLSTPHPEVRQDAANELVVREDCDRDAGDRVVHEPAQGTPARSRWLDWPESATTQTGASSVSLDPSTGAGDIPELTERADFGSIRSCAGLCAGLRTCRHHARSRTLGSPDGGWHCGMGVGSCARVGYYRHTCGEQRQRDPK